MAARAPIITPFTNNVEAGAHSYSYASLHELAWDPATVAGATDVPEFRTDIYPKYHRLYGDGFRLITFLYAAGLMMPPTTSSRMTVFEEPELERLVTLDGASNTPAAGADIVFNVIADDVDYPMLERSIYLPGEYFVGGTSTPKECIVTDVTGPAVTASPLDETAELAVAIPDGTTLTVGGAKYGRGGGQPGARRKSNLQRDFYTTILGETAEWEGGVNTFRPEMGMIDSEGHKTLFDKGLWETEFMLERSKDKAVWLSEYNTNNVQAATRGGTSNVESFVGFRNQLDDRAQTLPYADTIEPQDLKYIREIYESQGVQADMSWGGFGPRLWENIQDSGLEFIREGYSDSDLFKNLDSLGAKFGVIDLYGHKLVATELKTLGDQTSYGNGSYNFTNEGFIVPLTTVSGKSENGEKMQLNNIGIGYRKGNNENRTLMNGVVAGVNGMGFPFVDQFDSSSYYMKCEFRFAALGVNQMINVLEV